MRFLLKVMIFFVTVMLFSISEFGFLSLGALFDFVIRDF